MDRVRFTVWVSPDDFLGMLAAADVLLDSFHFGGFFSRAGNAEKSRR